MRHLCHSSFRILHSAFCIALALATASARAELVQTGRAITIAETNRVGAAIVSVRLAFAPTATETNTLYMAYGEADQGDDIDAWDHVDLVGVVPPETNAWTCAMPYGWGNTSLNARFFLAKGVALPYDYEVEYLESDGNQHVKLPAATYTSLHVRFMKTEPHGRRVGLAGANAHFWYDVTAAGAYHGGGTCTVDAIFDFVSTNEYVWIDGVSRGSFSYSGDNMYNTLNGLAALMVGSWNSSSTIFKGRFYFIRQWNGDQPLINGVPCMRNGTAYFYNTVTHTFIGRSGSGSFTPGPQVGFACDQETRTPVSCSASLGAGLSLIVASALDVPTGMDPAPGSYPVTAATLCTSPATYDTTGVRYTCGGYTLETFQNGEWTQVATSEDLSYTCPADGVMRRLTWLWELTHYKIDIAAPPVENGAISVSPSSADGFFPVGTSVTLTPVPAEGKTHVGWYVTFDKVVAPSDEHTLTTAFHEGPLTLVADCPQTVASYFAGGWTYDASNSKDRRIYNGAWNFTVIVSSSPAGLLLKTWRAGHGRLDFTDFEADTGLKIVGTDGTLFHQQAYSKGPTSLYAPDMQKVTARAFQYCYRITDAILSPDLSVVEFDAFYDAWGLTNFQPRVCGKLTTIGSKAFMNSSKMRGDFSFPSLTSLADGAFRSTALTSVRLPVCTTIAADTFNACTKLTNAVTAATTINGSAFYNCSALRNVELTAKTSVTIAASAFNVLPANADIWYFGENAPASLPSKVLYGSNANALPRLHVRRGNDAEGWKALCTRVKGAGAGQTELTAADLARADYPGKRTLGIMNATDQKRIWVLADPLDSATILTLR